MAMDALTQAEVLALIREFNDLLGKMDPQFIKQERDYQSRKRAIVADSHTRLDTLEKTYRRQTDEIKSCSREALKEAKNILADVDSMDEQLLAVDKYYKKTKLKKESELANVQSPKYQKYDDLLSGLEAIRKEYQALSKKYREQMLPFLLNDLHFLFSGQRKHDYEDLIVLQNTVHHFVDSVKDILPQITEEELKEKRDRYYQEQKIISLRYSTDLDTLEKQNEAGWAILEKQAQQQLDTILPREFVDYMAQTAAAYCQRREKVNSGSQFSDGILWMSFAEYPLAELVGSDRLRKMVLKRCAGMTVKETVRFPLPVACKGADALMVMTDPRFPEQAKALSHAWLFGMLASSPVAGLRITVVDPENRGTSVGPFFDARKRLPELFEEKFCLNAEEIEAKLSELNEFIETTLMDQLGAEYETIFDYAQAHPGEKVQIRCLVVYDFPRGMDDAVLGDLRNILRNGSRCGIYVMLLCPPPQPGRRNDAHQQMLQVIQPLTAVISQDQEGFSICGLPLLYEPMPNKAGFDRFFSKYMIIYEGLQNRGIAFSPLLQKLVQAKTVPELDQQIQTLTELRQQARCVLQEGDLSTTFPEQMLLGEISYPAEIFDESIDHKKIVRAFCQRSGDNTAVAMNRVLLPMIFDLHRAINLKLAGAQAQSEQVHSIAYRVIWNLLSRCPAAKVNFCIYDPKESGGSVRLLSSFMNKMPDPYSKAIVQISRAEDLAQKLKELSRQIDDFIQKRPDYADLLDYNRSNPRRTEAVTLLLLYDFPMGMDARSLDLLASIQAKGGKCGIYTVICANTDIPAASGYERLDEKIAAMDKNSVLVECKENSCTLLPYHLPVLLPAEPDQQQIAQFAQQYAKAVEKLNVQSISFEEILPPVLYQGSTAQILKLPMGIGEGDTVVSMVFGQGTSHHGLIGGGTGGGKSTLLHTLIMSAMTNYSPEQLNLYLMDFKGGTEFKIYESERLPHIKLLALDAMQEFGESILEKLVAEMEARSTAFKEAGGYTKLEDYVNQSGNPMPRILVIMDEFQILFDDQTNRKVAEHCANLTKRIVTEGRAYGIHLLMATQSTKIIASLTLDRGTIEQMRIRVGLKCGEDDTHYLFGDQHMTDALAKMAGPRGTAVMNEDYTEDSPNVGLRVAFCDTGTKKKYLQMISETFADSPCTTQVFEGSRTVPMLDYFASAGIGWSACDTTTIYMGAKIKVADPFEIALNRKRRHNMLVCGSNDDMMNRVVNLFLISAALNRSTAVYCVDGDVLVGENICGELYRTLADHTPQFHCADSRAEIVRYVHDVYQMFQERKKSNQGSTILFVIKNLQFLDLVQTMLAGDRVDESEYLTGPETPPAAPALKPAEEQPARPAESGKPETFDPFADLLAAVPGLAADQPSGSTPEQPGADPFADLLAAVPGLVADQPSGSTPEQPAADPFADLLASAPSLERSLGGAAPAREAGGTSDAAEKLQKLITEGSGYGIHFVVGAADYQTVKECMRYGAGSLNKFPERIVFSLNDADADNLIDGVSVANLRDNTVYYTDGVKNAFQFKPYVSPTAVQLAGYLESCTGTSQDQQGDSW